MLLLSRQQIKWGRAKLSFSSSSESVLSVIPPPSLIPALVQEGSSLIWDEGDTPTSHQVDSSQGPSSADELRCKNDLPSIISNFLTL